MKALEQLAQQGKIKEKTYGKQKIYFADQVRRTCADHRPCETPTLGESISRMNSLLENLRHPMKLTCLTPCKWPQAPFKSKRVLPLL